MNNPNYFSYPGINKFGKYPNVSYSEGLINNVMKRYDITHSELMGRSRLAKICEARNIMFYGLHRVLKIPCMAVGEMLSRNHATVLSGAARIRGIMDIDSQFNSMVNNMLSESIPYMFLHNYSWSRMDTVGSFINGEGIICEDEEK